MLKYGLILEVVCFLKNKIVKVALVAITLCVLSTVTTSPGNAIYIDYLGRVTRDQWVPFFVLYDPPGDMSYASVTQCNGLALGIGLSGHFEGFGATGSFDSGYLWYSGGGTPDNQRSSGVLASEYSMQWDIYLYEFPSHSLYKAVLVSATPYAYSVGEFSFADCDSHGMIVQSQIGQPAPNEYHRYVSQNWNGYDDLYYTWTTAQSADIGIKFSAFGINFDAGLQITENIQQSFEIYYYYRDSTQALDFYVCTNYPFSNVHDNIANVSGIQIWFSE